MSDEARSIELEVQVPGTPGDVWRAVATGPGISSWYVPHQVDERAGGEAVASFGPGPEMQVAGRVAVWEPPRRVVFDGGEGVDGLTFDWLVEAIDDRTCVVRLRNTGFGPGEEWSRQYDGMVEGWPLFLTNLRLHLEHFRGGTATALLPSGSWTGPRNAAWSSLCGALGIPSAPALDDCVDVGADDAPDLAGTVVDVAPARIALLLDRPAPGTAFVAVEGEGGTVRASIWSYLYGPGAADIARRDERRWRRWLDDHGAPPG